ncbi:MAG: FecCD family ABC transporter permease [Candidatus Ornithospirochaeta sp.]
MLVPLFIVVFALSFMVGRYPVSPFVAIKILFSKLIGTLSGGRLGFTGWSGTEEAVVMNIRFPRIALASLIGASLSLAGASYQSIFRNPMVSPDLLGASTGAGFGAALAILLGGGYFSITLSSFAFGLLAVVLALLVASRSRLNITLSLVLSGVMVSSLFSSGTSFVKLVADTSDQLPAITYYLMGSLSSVKKDDLLFAFIPMVLGMVPVLLLRWRVNLLTVDEAEARSMGIDTGKLRLVVVLSATLMTSASVAVSGMIGWVGLVVPHFSRLIYGDDSSITLPTSALLGAIFLLVVDNIARIATTAEIPLGILTSFVGAPVFLYLIMKGGRSIES